MFPADLPAKEPEFLARFGTDEACRAYLFAQHWPTGFCCERCKGQRCYAHKKRIIYECTSCKKQHSLLAGTMFEQTKTGLSKWFLAIYFNGSPRPSGRARFATGPGSVSGGRPLSSKPTLEQDWPARRETLRTTPFFAAKRGEFEGSPLEQASLAQEGAAAPLAKRISRLS